MDAHLFQSLAAAEPSSVQNLPWVAHALVGAALVAGVIMWLSGGKLLKPIFCILGALAGGAVGFLVAPSATSSVFGVPSPYVGLGIGAVIGLVAGVSLFRFAVAIATGLAFAIAGLLISSTYLNLTVGLSSPKPVELPTSALATSPEPAHSSAEAAKRAVMEGFRPVAERVRMFVSENASRLKDTWSAQTEHNKVVLGVSTAGAALFGFFISLFAPRRSTSLATALFGSAIVLGGSVWLLRAFDAPGSKYLVQGPMVWLGVWIVATVLGVAVQMRTGGSHKPAPAAPA
ncbi:MAG TPA: hypothetical protein VFT91_04655 [Dehalococcoidia bacterium]|nr:hypothetical protein [Dehalococcoidia bacterium]